MEHISHWSMLMMGDNIDTIKKNTETPIYASKEAGLEVNAERIKYMQDNIITYK
jgi:diaminopimelate decarboxylase